MAYRIEFVGGITGQLIRTPHNVWHVIVTCHFEYLRRIAADREVVGKARRLGLLDGVSNQRLAVKVAEIFVLYALGSAARTDCADNFADSARCNLRICICDLIAG